MQRYEPAVCQPNNFEVRPSLVKEGEFPRNHLDAVPVYIASDVDERIEQLEKALKSCAFVIRQEIGVQRTFQLIAAQALAEADKALALMAG